MVDRSDTMTPEAELEDIMAQSGGGGAASAESTETFVPALFGVDNPAASSPMPPPQTPQTLSPDAQRVIEDTAWTNRLDETTREIHKLSDGALGGFGVAEPGAETDAAVQAVREELAAPKFTALDVFKNLPSPKDIAIGLFGMGAQDGAVEGNPMATVAKGIGQSVVGGVTRNKIEGDKRKTLALEAYEKNPEAGITRRDWTGAVRASIDAGAQSFADIPASVIDSVGIGANIAGWALPGSEREIDQDNSARAVARWAKAVARSYFPGDATRQEDFAVNLARGIGSTAGFMSVNAAGLAARLSKPGSMVITAIVGAMANAPNTYEQAIQSRREGRDVPDFALAAVFVAGLGLGASEALPIAKNLPLPPGSKSKLVAYLTTILREGGEEALQELGQAVGEDLVARIAHDPNRRIGDEANINSLVGFIAGGGLQAARLGYSRAAREESIAHTRLGVEQGNKFMGWREAKLRRGRPDVGPAPAAAPSAPPAAPGEEPTVPATPSPAAPSGRATEINLDQYVEPAQVPNPVIPAPFDPALEFSPMARMKGEAAAGGGAAETPPIPTFDVLVANRHLYPNFPLDENGDADLPAFYDVLESVTGKRSFNALTAEEKIGVAEVLASGVIPDAGQGAAAPGQSATPASGAASPASASDAEARYINRYRAGDSTLSDDELRQQYRAKVAARSPVNADQQAVAEVDGAQDDTDVLEIARRNKGRLPTSEAYDRALAALDGELADQIAIRNQTQADIEAMAPGAERRSKSRAYREARDAAAALQSEMDGLTAARDQLAQDATSEVDQGLAEAETSHAAGEPAENWSNPALKAGLENGLIRIDRDGAPRRAPQPDPEDVEAEQKTRIESLLERQISDLVRDASGDIAPGRLGKSVAMGDAVAMRRLIDSVAMLSDEDIKQQFSSVARLARAANRPQLIARAVQGAMARDLRMREDAELSNSARDMIEQTVEDALAGKPVSETLETVMTDQVVEGVADEILNITKHMTLDGFTSVAEQVAPVLNKIDLADRAREAETADAKRIADAIIETGKAIREHGNNSLQAAAAEAKVHAANAEMAQKYPVETGLRPLVPGEDSMSDTWVGDVSRDAAPITDEASQALLGLIRGVANRIAKTSDVTAPERTVDDMIAAAAGSRPEKIAAALDEIGTDAGLYYDIATEYLKPKRGGLTLAELQIVAREYAARTAKSRTKKDALDAIEAEFNRRATAEEDAATLSGDAAIFTREGERRASERRAGERNQRLRESQRALPDGSLSEGLPEDGEGGDAGRALAGRGRGSERAVPDNRLAAPGGTDEAGLAGGGEGGSATERGAADGQRDRDGGNHTGAADPSIANGPPLDTPLTVVFGGSFNPIHEGHAIAIRNAVSFLKSKGYGIRRVVIAPTPDKLLKNKLGARAYPLEDRAQMARLQLANDAGFVVETGPALEVEQMEGKPKRTQLANWATANYPDGSNVINVTGADAAPGSPPGYPSAYQGDPGTSHEGYYYLAMPRDEGDGMSSSTIRNALVEGKPVPGGMMTAEAQAYLMDLLGRNPTLLSGETPQPPAEPEEIDIDAPNFGLPEMPKTLPDGHPLLTPHWADEKRGNPAHMDTSPEREAMRERLIEQRFVGKSPSEYRPIAYMMGGGSASGKGTILKALMRDGYVDDNFVHLDPDSFKTGDKDEGFDGIPEYDQILAAGDGRAAMVVHEESSHIFKRARKRAVDGGYDLVLDRTLGDPKKAAEEIRMLVEDGGYRVVLIGVSVRAQVAIKRAVERAKMHNRWVPMHDALRTHKGFSQGFEKYAGKADEVVLFDTEVPFGSDAVIMAVGGRDIGLTVVNEQAYNNFIKKGELDEKESTLRALARTQAGVAAPVLEGDVARGFARARRAIEEKRASGPGGLSRERLTLPEGANHGAWYRSVLLHYGGHPELYGKDQARSLEKAGQEIADGEVRLVVENGELIREADVLGLDVYADVPGQGRMRLTEDRQEMKDGRTVRREGLQAVSEKLLPGENPADVIARALKEELGVTRFDMVGGLAKPEPQEPFVSPRYPGLKSRYIMTKATVEITGSDVKPEGYTEEQADKTNYFVWKPAPQTGAAKTAARTKEVLADADTQRAARIARNYRIADADEIGSGGPKAKVRGNIEAIRIVRTLEQENRQATEDERKKLVKYVGWGAFAQDLFKDTKPEWARERQLLADLLTAEEYAAASASTLNAHYTSKDVIDGMWKAMQHLGFEGGRAIEPAAGIGHFIGLTPDKVAAKTDWVAVELDKITGAIAKHLYQGSDVRISGYEATPLPDNFFDLAISNVPFGDFKVEDRKHKGMLIHDYFFAKSLDKVRPGGVVAFITSMGTMDKASERVRRLIDAEADLVGAIRLPGGNKGAFKANAGTDVTTDIVFLRKRAPGEPRNPEANKWIDTVEIKTPEGPTRINRYFAEHPDMMLGKMRLTGTMYRNKTNPVLIGPTNELGNRIAEAALKMPANVITARSGVSEDIGSAPEMLADSGIKEGSLFIKGGKVYQNVEGKAVPQKIAGKNLTRVRKLLALRDLYNEILLGQTRGDFEKMGGLRADLNKAYDEFVAKFGPINKTNISTQKRKDGVAITTRRMPNVAGVTDDPDYYKLLALEIYNEETGAAVKTAIFSENVVEPYKRPSEISGPADALAVSLNETGGVDMGRIADIMGVSEAAAAEALGERVYLDPNGETYRTSEIYLSGDVVTKLEEAKAAAEADKRYERNIAPLEAAQPDPLTRVDIRLSFGAPWIPVDVYNAYIAKVIGLRGGNVRFEPVTSTWVYEKAINKSWHAHNNIATNDAYGTKRVGAPEIVIAALNGKTITVTNKVKDADGSVRDVVDTEATEDVRAKIRLVQDTFTGDQNAGITGWAFEDEGRASLLEALYNRTFNRLVRTEYDGSHLSLPGLAVNLTLPNGKIVPLWRSKHRLNAIWRAISSGNMLMDHAVGSGKTITSVAAAMEMKRLGMIQRPMFVVPNHMLEQFGREFLQAYPGAKLLVASKDNMKAANRKAFAARISSEKWDGIIITHSSFGKLPMQDQAYIDFIEEQVAEMVEAWIAAKKAAGEEVTQKDIDDFKALATDAQKDDDGPKKKTRGGKKDPTVKEIERKKKTLQTQLNKMLNKDAKDTGTLFEELGVDYLVVDEAHAFKNLTFTTTHSNVKGLGVNGSQRAMDMFLKIRHIEKSRPGRSTMFMTGTPMSRSMAEIYTMQRYLQLDTLKAYGLDKFDAWAATFGRVVTNSEQGVDQKIKDVASFSKFINVPELQQVYSLVTDSLTAQQLNLPRPAIKGGRPQVVISQMSAAEEAATKDLIREMEQLKGPSEKGKANHLSLFGRMLQIATDARLDDPSAPFNPNGKVAKLVSNVSRIYREGKHPALTQMIFLDMGVPTSKAKAKTKTKGKSRTEDIGDTEYDGDTEVDQIKAEADAEVAGALQGKFNLYADIKQRLIDEGIPAKEIAFIHDAKTDDAKAKMFKAMREGKIRVLLGSSAKMGVGTNVQNLLVALHHVDSPWNPADVVQRDGRIERQGNQNKEIEIFRYVTEKSADAYRWQILARKAEFEAQFRAGARGLREAEDIDSPIPEASVLKALATGDDRIIRHAQLNREVRDLEAAKRGHERSYLAAQRSLGEAKARLAANEAFATVYGEDAAKVQDVSGKGFKVRLDLPGKRGEIKERKAAGEAIRDYVMEQMRYSWSGEKARLLTLGEISGFKVIIEAAKTVDGVVVLPWLHGAAKYSATSGRKMMTEKTDPVGLMRAFENMLIGIPGLHASAQRLIGEDTKLIAQLSPRATPSPFPREAQMIAMKAEYEALDKELKSFKETRTDETPEETIASEDAAPLADIGDTEELASFVRPTLANRIASVVGYAREAVKAGVALGDNDDGTPFVGAKEAAFQRDMRLYRLQKTLLEELNATGRDTGGAADSGSGTDEPGGSAAEGLAAAQAADTGSGQRAALGEKVQEPGFRARAIEAFLSPEMRPGAIEARATAQGFTLDAYHGTLSDFDTPNPFVSGRDFGFHVALGSPHASNMILGAPTSLADRYSRFLDRLFSRVEGFRQVENNANVMPLKLRVRNPLRLPDVGVVNGGWSDPLAMRNLLQHRDSKAPESLKRWVDQWVRDTGMGDVDLLWATRSNHAFSRAFAKELERLGYDAIIYKNTMEGIGRDSMLLWDASQIRSAFDFFHDDAAGAPGLMASLDYVEQDLADRLAGLMAEEGMDRDKEIYSFDELAAFARQDQLGYYSGALRAAYNLRQDKGTPEQMLVMLGKEGAKKAELDVTGLAGFLEGKKSVTKDEIISYLERGRLEMNEVLRGRDDMHGRIKQDVEEDFAGVDQTKWSSYSLDPGNPTYRETVLHLPKIGYDESALDPRRWNDGHNAASRAGDPNFRSGHFPEPNIVGHMMTSMVQHDGRATYLLDQIQSDWGQKLRDGGVRDESKIADLGKRVDVAREEMYTLRDEYDVTVNRVAGRYRGVGDTALPGKVEAAVNNLNILEAELRTAEAAVFGHSLVNTTDQWVNTTLRRAIRQAAEADAEYIAIPTGRTVESYNPQGDSEGNAVFYERIVPKNLRNLLRKIDKQSPDPVAIDKLDTPTSGMKGNGFTLFKLTDKVKQSVVEEGQALFSFAQKPQAGNQRFTPEMAAVAPQVKDDIIARLQRMLPAGTAVRLADRLFHKNGREEMGRFRPALKLIEASLAYGAQKAFAAGAHETVHVLREAGAFTDSEWSALVERARKTVDMSGLVGTYRDVYRQYAEAQGMTGDLANAFVARRVEEEYVARLAEEYFSETKPRFGSTVEALLQRIGDILDAIAQAFGGQGFTTPERIFRRMEQGQIADRVAPKRQRQLASRSARQDEADDAAVAKRLWVPSQQSTRAFSLSGFTGSLAITDRADGLQNRVYAVTDDNGNPVVSIALAERDADLFEIVGVRIAEKKRGRGVALRAIGAIERDLGRPLMEGGVMARDTFEKVAQTYPERVRFHVQGGRLFDGLILSPRALHAMAEGSEAADDDLSAIESEGIRNLIASVPDQYYALERMTDEMAAFREGLDMSPQARKARAEEMGFDTSRVWYHGSRSKDVAAFDPGAPKNYNIVGDAEGIYLTSDQMSAFNYAKDRTTKERGKVYAAYVRLRNPLNTTAAIKGRKKGVNFGDAKRAALANVDRSIHDGVIFDGDDVNPPEVIVFDPTNIRSVNAAFDPAESDSADILSSFKRDDAPRGASTSTHLPQLGNMAESGVEPELSKGLSDLVTLLVEAIGTEARIGRLNPGLKAAMGRVGAKLYGHFSRTTGLIRMAIPNDLPTLVHEGGHALETHAALGPHVEGIKQAFASELIPLKSPGKDGLSEGWAEWFRFYVTDPAQSQSLAPQTYAAFRKMLEVQAPEILAALDGVQQGYQQLIAASPAAAVMSRTKHAMPEQESLMREVAEKGLRSTISDRIYGFTRDVTDAKHPLKIAARFLIGEATKRLGTTLNQNQFLHLKGVEDPYKLARMMEHAKVHATAVLQHGVRRNGASLPSGPSMQDVLKEAFGGMDRKSWNDARFQQFGSYLVARRMNAEWDRFDNGQLENAPDHLIPREAWGKAQSDLEQAFPEFKRAARKFDVFVSNLLEWKYQNGFITDELYDELSMRDGYAPLNRIMDQSGPSALAKAKGDNKRQLMFRFRGSTRDFINPVESIIADVYTTQARVELNNVIKALDKTARAAGPNGGLIAERIPSHDIRAKELDMTDLHDRLKKETEKIMEQAVRSGAIAKWDVDNIMDQMDTLLDQTSSQTLFSAVETSSVPGERIVYLWENGKRVPVLLGSNMLGEDIFNIFAGVGNPADLGFGIENAVFFTQMFRAGVTKSPAYIAVNWFRDQLATWALSKNFTPFWTGFKGMGNIIRDDDPVRMYQHWAGMMGGIDANLIDQMGKDRDAMTLRKSGFFAAPSKWQSFLRTMEITEAASRVGHMKQAFDNYIEQGYSEEEAAFEAAYNAHDVMDFSMRGSRMMAASRLIAFLNAQLQGMYAALRTMKGERDEVVTIAEAVSPYLKATEGQPLTIAEKAALPNSSMIWLKLVSIGLFGLALALLYRDDPEYEELSQGDMGHTHWFFKLGGTWWRVPKPFELAIFSNLFEAMFARIEKGDEMAMQRFLLSIRETMGFTPEMQAFSGINAIYQGGRSLLNTVTGKPQYGNPDENLPQRLRGLPPELQWDAYTSEFSKMLAATFGISAYKTDQAIRDMFASVGRDLLTVGDYVLPRANMLAGGAIPGVEKQPRADKSFEDKVFLSRITRRASRGSYSATHFWQDMNSDNGRFVNAAKGFKTLMDTHKDARRAQQHLMSLPDEERAFTILEYYYKEKDQDMHPLNRAKQVIQAINAVRRGMANNQLYEQKSEKKGREPVQIAVPSSQQKVLNEILEDIAMREARNAQIVLGKPGWSQMSEMSTDGLWRELQAAHPALATELHYRLTHGRYNTYSFDAVRQVWPEVRKQLLSETPGTSLAGERARARIETPRQLPLIDGP